MTFTTDTAAIDPAMAERREQRLAQIRRLCGALQLVGLGCFAPLLRLIAGANPREELTQLWRQLGLPRVISQAPCSCKKGLGFEKPVVAPTSSSSSHSMR